MTPTQPTDSSKLKSCRVCEGLTEDEVRQIAAVCDWRELAAGEIHHMRDNLCTVAHGRLRMYHQAAPHRKRFMGYVNQGDTVGLSSFLLHDLSDEIDLIADIRSSVAILSGENVMRLIFEIPVFRRNVIAAFGVRAANVFRGVKPRRFPKVVGVVSTNSRSAGFLPLLARELTRAQEALAVFTSRPASFPTAATTPGLPAEDAASESGFMKSRIQGQFPECDRVLIDFGPSRGVSARGRTGFNDLAKECEELLWCCDNQTPDQGGEHELRRLIEESPHWNNRVVGVQLLAEGETIGRKVACCPDLVHRDFLVPQIADTSEKDRLFDQAMDRIVRHLRGLKVGIALGGGGARGMSHLGVLRVLDRSRIGFDLMSGTSVGAMVGLGYAAGFSPDYLIQSFSRDLQPSQWMSRIPFGRRLYLFQKFQERAWEKMLRAHYRDWTFRQLLIPFCVVATDLVSGEEVVRDSGDIVEAILESINVPLLADPIMRDGKILVDGGVVNNLPAELLNERGAEYVIGVDVSKEIPGHFAGNYPHTRTGEMKQPSLLETAYRVMDVSRRGIAKLQMGAADDMIEPDTSAFDFADFTSAASIAETGQFAAEARLEQIRKTYDALFADTSATTHHSPPGRS